MTTAYRPYWQDTGCRPSVLLVTEGCGQRLEFKQWLEAKGCQVHRVTLADPADLLISYRTILFDLTVINIELIESMQFNETYKALLLLYQNFVAVPALLTLPMVVMTTCEQIEATIANLALRPIYRIPQNTAARNTLLQTIEQIFYLNYRYS